MFLKIISQLDEKTIAAILKLADGFSNSEKQLFLVGGAVRDLLEGKEPKDFDFASDASLEWIKDNFEAIATGEDHGTLTVKIDGFFFEITRFRKDVSCDGRNATIEFAETIQEDLGRRDFTINAIAINLITGKLVDPFNGVDDLMAKRLVFVGNAEARIKEDHLRALRWIRFIARGFVPQDSIEKICSVFNESVLSRERVIDELKKISESIWKTSKSKEVNEVFHAQLKERIVFRFLDALGILKKEFKSEIDASKVILQILSGKFINVVMKTVELEGKERALEILKLSKREIELAFFANRLVVCSSKKELKSILFKMEKELNVDAVKEAKRLCHEIVFKSMTPKEDKESILLELSKIEDEKIPFTLKHLVVSGLDLIKLGFSGKDIGSKLEKMLEWVWEHPEDNKKETLLEGRVFYK